MSIIELGALGEFVSATAILITLVFLIVQLRQTTVSVRSASRGNSAIAIAELDRDIAKDPELAKIFHRSFATEPVEYSELEWFRFVTAARSMIGLFEDQYIQSTVGTAPKEQAEIYIASMWDCSNYPLGSDSGKRKLPSQFGAKLLSMQ